jgi:BirA family transcriptional regulator, biotin operon repressor / biotin---[acetyl-CoA-carboxylase] ligase
MVQNGREVNLSSTAARASIDNPWPGAGVSVVERTGSTMDDCLALGLRGFPTGTAVVAGFQDRGRGRAPGRRWLSPSWESLLVTVLLHADDLGFAAVELPLRAGLAVSRAVEDATGVAAGIRWPNDALMGGRKVAGILCEAHGGLLLVGIGVNCLQRAFPPEIADRAGSLLLATGRTVSPLALCPLVLARLREAVSDPRWRDGVERRLVGRGARVRVEPVGAGDAAEGVVLGLDGDGALLLRGDDGVVRRAAQGEISGCR